MDTALSDLERQTQSDWLIGHSSQEVLSLTQDLIQELLAHPIPHPNLPLKILLAHRDPVQFLAHFIAASTVPTHLFLCNPDWAEAEWQQVFELVQPDLVWQDERCHSSFVIRHWAGNSRRQEADLSYSLGGAAPPPKNQSKIQNPKSKIQNSQIYIPTGGTSGQIRFVVHTWDTLMASVRGFQQYFEVERVNCCCVLPLYHVSGLMQVMRSLTSGGQLLILPFKTFEAGHIPAFDSQHFFLSLVPTQLHRLLQSTHFMAPSPAQSRSSGTALPGASPPPYLPHLRTFKAILLGGAPAWPELLQQAREYRLPLAPTYGMTETASQIATLKPADFLQGKTGAGRVLPHAQVEICNEQGDRLPPNRPGGLHIHSQSLALGYYALPIGTNALNHVPTIPSAHHPIAPPFLPDDIGYLDSDGYLHLLGRNSDKIITGGENVFPAEVEAAIQATGLVQDVCVMGVSDRLWGQAITAFYSPVDAKTEAASIKAALQNRLSKFKYPKYWIALESLPRNAQGKINRVFLRDWMADHSPVLADCLLHTEPASE